MEIKTGDRVKMDLSRNTGDSMFDVPDLGEGVVGAVEGEGLMEGWYVWVDWDAGYGGLANRVAIDALVKVEDRALDAAEQAALAAGEAVDGLVLVAGAGFRVKA